MNLHGIDTSAVETLKRSLRYFTSWTSMKNISVSKSPLSSYLSVYIKSLPTPTTEGNDEKNKLY